LAEADAKLIVFQKSPAKNSFGAQLPKLYGRDRDSRCNKQYHSD